MSEETYEAFVFDLYGTLYIHTETSPQLMGKPEADYTVLDGNWHRAAEILMGVAGLR